MKIAFLSLFIACAAVALSLLQAEKYEDSNQNLHRQFIRLEDDLKGKMEDLESHLRLVKEQNKNMPPPLNTHQWRRFEIESLLTLAHTQYQSANQLGSVLTLLASAAQKLNTLADPQLKPLEMALNQDLKTLGSIQLVDKQARCQQLDQIVKQIAALSFQQRSLSNPTASISSPTESALAAVPMITTTDTQTSWRTLLANSLQNLKELVKIQRHTKPIEPLLSNVEQGLVQQQARLLLEQTRLAILIGDQTLYDQTIKAVLDDLDHYYNQLENIAPIKQSLLSLSTQSVVNVLPTLHYIDQLSLLRPSP